MSGEDVRRRWGLVGGGVERGGVAAATTGHDFLTDGNEAITQRAAAAALHSPHLTPQSVTQFLHSFAAATATGGQCTTSDVTVVGNHPKWPTAKINQSEESRALGHESRLLPFEGP